ncbi:hypothetical protein GCM10010210_15810 [Pseudonocardia hydrocarbonoxydans]|uniref:Uncharacterized protein n=1 Tax=Pseudonocardia hydrocarbonoxydans TaxID=76726 RepID=A0A4Y3WQN3_9PSEU|nr:hypothetical protein PHY01_34850 [Pseudonocardia hydrocarbonoxydans]
MTGVLDDVADLLDDLPDPFGLALRTHAAHLRPCPQRRYPAVLAVASGLLAQVAWRLPHPGTVRG